ncbi:hypothetical protein PG2089B_1568 [Bifidobacterium pseudolongum subsp. globosum]|nr:hypothetical protein PG2089B_1568 [Bifidobacterium pseudolongum subsp. globosum]
MEMGTWADWVSAIGGGLVGVPHLSIIDNQEQKERKQRCAG